MAGNKLVYVCSSCGTPHEKWQGRCKGCGSWNTLVEEITEKSSSKSVSLSDKKPVSITEIESKEALRQSTQDSEFDRVLGGGMVEGSVILLGGEPGIGKSTLALQTFLHLSGKKTLYVCGEESLNQVKLRSERLGTSNAELFLFDETSIDLVLNAAEKLHPDYLVIDSIQTVYTDKTDAVPGSLSQVKECTSMLTRFAKKTGVTVLLIGHITKDGLFAGPKALEHMVDVVLGFEGDRHHLYRIVRTHKNRFGSTQEIGIYKMVPEGLLPVLNPSEIFLNLTGEEASGVAVAATMEGNRPMLVETQALVTPTVFGNGQRSATGMDLRRLNMLLAVLEKKGGFKFSDKDVFLNFVGGMKTEDPSADLAVAAALVSSSHNLSINQKYVFIAEVGLTGELRPVLKPEQRIAEAEKLGFTKAFIATDSDKRTLAHKTSIEVFPCRKLTDVFSTIFG